MRSEGRGICERRRITALGKNALGRRQVVAADSILRIGIGKSIEVGAECEQIAGSQLMIHARDKKSLAEISGEKRPAFERRCNHRVADLMVILRGHHEVCAVLYNWAGNRASALLESILRFQAERSQRRAAFGKCRPARPAEVSVEIIGSGFCDDIYGGTRSAPVFGGTGVGNYRKFLHGRERKCGQQCLTAPTIVSRRVVNRKSCLTPSASIHYEKRFIGEEVPRRVRGPHVGIKKNKRRQFVVQDRSVLNLLKIETTGNLTGIGLQSSGSSVDSYVRFRRCDIHCDIDGRRMACLQLDVAAVDRTEIRGGYR